MLRAAVSAGRRPLFSLIALAGFVALSLGLSGCAGVVSSSGGTTSNPTGTLSISNVQAGGATNSSVQLSWATNEPSNSAIDYGTTSVYGASTPVSGTMVTAHQMTLSGLAQGTTYHFRVRSANGSETASSPDQTFSTLGGSNTPPSVQVTSPAAGATLSGKVNLTAVASDNGSVSGVQFRVDGSNVGPDLSASPYVYVLDSTSLSNGAHSITAVATDNTGNSTTSAGVAVKIDNTVKDTTPPTVAMTSPTNGAKVSGTVAVTATASDNVSVASVQFELDGANLGTADVAAPYHFSWDSTKVANGTHSLRAIATDSAGNSATSPAINITVDNTTKDTTPPTVSITAPANGAKLSGVVAVTANASDNVSVARLQFEIDGVNVGAPDLAAPYAYSWDTSKTSNGSHTLKAVATDGAGNSTTSATVTVTVNNTATDKTPPTVTITAPAASATVSATVTITATAADNVGVASVQFQVDGVNAGGLDGATPYAFAWDTTKVANGVHRLDAVARDAAGNTTTSATVTVTVNNAAANNFSISGTVSGAGGSGATVTLSGQAVAATATNASGAYNFTGLAKGTYTVTPSHTGFTFGPASQNTTITTANATGVNFTSTAVAGQTFSISGTISGTGGAGATVALGGASTATTTATANASGAYTFTGLPKGNYTVTPNHAGFTFSPTSLAESITTTNITGANFTATATAPQTFSISGTISGSGGSGATVKLTGGSTATATANASGAYTFPGLAKGSYTVTPSHTGFTFSPTSLAETITTANITGANFTATATAPQTFSISGTISGSGGSGATVKLTGGSTATANASGAYTFPGLAKGSYTVTPSHTGFTFSPTSLAETITTANITGANFTATATAPQTFSISGTISGSGGSGATVKLTGGSTATANASGAYTFPGLAKGSYTVTPSHTGFTFSPTSLAETITTANITGANFTATATASQTFSISGTISGSGGSGATVKLTGGSTATATANASGAYTFPGLAKGSYTVTPSHTGFTFSPTSLAESITTANITGANFTATATASQTFSISGTISGSGGSGATVKLTGGSTATATANASGAYTFPGLAKGSYTVTPSHTGFTFSPTSLAESITTANITGANFTATATTPQTFSISGTISGSGGSGAAVKLTGTSTATATANASGAYTLTGLAKGSYTVTPSHTGFTFGPTALVETITTANITGVNFTSTPAAPQTFSISGTVSGTGASGTTLTLSGASSATTTANASGAFTFTGLAKGTYAITPGHSGFTFSPSSQSATIGTANVTSMNFTSAAAAATFSISGTITPASGGSGATVILSGAAGATTTTSSSGTYTFTGLANGNYTVTPSNSGFALSPASTNVTISGANKTGVNFTAASNKPHFVTLSWNASTSKVSGYHVYRSTTSGSGFVKLNASLVTSTSYQDTTVQNAMTYFYVTTSVDSSGDESTDSNQVSVTVP